MDTEVEQMSERANRLVRTGLDSTRQWIEQFSSTIVEKYCHRQDGIISDDSQQQQSLVSNFESILVEFQSLLIWENPFNSALALTTFTCFYWLAVLWSPRLFSIIAIIFFCYHFYEMWTRYVWPEIRVPSTETKEKWTSINPNVLSAPEIQSCLDKMNRIASTVFYEIVDLRRRSHGTFCFLSISILALFYILGRHIPGVVLVYTIAIILFLTPGFLLHVLPNDMVDSIVDYCNSLLPMQSQSDNVVVGLVKNQCETSSNDLDKPDVVKNVDKCEMNDHNINNSDDDTKLTKSAHISGSNSDLSDDFEIISESEYLAD